MLNNNTIKFEQKQNVDKENNNQTLTVKRVSNSNCEHFCFTKKAKIVNKIKNKKILKYTKKSIKEMLDLTVFVNKIKHKATPVKKQTCCVQKSNNLGLNISE